jgi:hypothetical protein
VPAAVEGTFEEFAGSNPLAREIDRISRSWDAATKIAPQERSARRSHPHE